MMIALIIALLHSFPQNGHITRTAYSLHNFLRLCFYVWLTHCKGHSLQNSGINLNYQHIEKYYNWKKSSYFITAYQGVSIFVTPPKIIYMSFWRNIKVPWLKIQNIRMDNSRLKHVFKGYQPMHSINICWIWNNCIDRLWCFRTLICWILPFMEDFCIFIVKSLIWLQNDSYCTGMFSTNMSIHSFDYT